jgi:hypothetical protein
MTNDESTSVPDGTPEAGPGINFSDSTGKFIGTFYKSGLPYRPEGYVIEGEWLSDVEIDRQSREGRTYTVAEVDAFTEELKRVYPTASMLKSQG